MRITALALAGLAGAAIGAVCSGDASGSDTSASHRYTIPSGFTLEPGATVRISSGRHLYWCLKGSAVWNNHTDTAYLLDPPGNIVDSHSYG